MYDASIRIIDGRRVESRVYEDISPELTLIAMLQPRVRADVRQLPFVARPLPAHWRKRLSHVGE